ncbi:MFS transporter [Aurantiacibacter gangjinensis]|uniref:MFS transporter n=1 Tax=Aurantiacibacter gangjinensis TaxID=502682 RepID=A0A0G9MMU8_9SPHN|nr:MFS transporter [Aurantiacibacter gangjinensis]APE28102.1 Major facilitator superfamily MFS_1 [Aurantiacibacter gangjinensis]KLE32025.1 MFS transporter [Aurantiacibacter gangjinensis]
MATAPKQRSEFGLGWKVLLVSVLGVAFGASPIPFNVVGFTVEPLMEEFGWSRTQIFLPITIFGIIASLLAPAFGWMADRYGVRKVALASLAAFGVAFAAVALTPTERSATTLYIYYGLWVVIGLVGIGSTPVTWSRAINMWFFKNKGLALGILLMGTSIAAMVIPQIASWAIGNYGWRGMFLIIAGLPLLVALPLGIIFFREPLPEERPDAVGGKAGTVTGVDLKTALRDYRFWLIWFSILTIAFAFGGAFINMVPILADHSFDTAAAANVMTILGIGILSGRIITGMLLDRFWAGYVAFPLLCLPAISSYLLLGTDTAFLPLAIGGFLLGFAAGAESDLIAYLASRYFGMLHYGKIYGMLYMPFGLASAFSPIVYAWVRDTYGTYDPMLTVAIFMYVAGGAMLLFLGRYPDNFPAPGAEPTRAVTGAA